MKFAMRIPTIPASTTRPRATAEEICAVKLAAALEAMELQEGA